MEEYKVCRVHWIDASYCAGWLTAAEIDAVGSEPYTVESVGWLLKDEPDYVMLGISVSKYRAADTLRIPRAYITDMWVVPNLENL